MTLNNRKLEPCDDCRNSEEDRLQDYKVCIGTSELSFSDATELAKNFSHSYGCCSYLEQRDSDSGWAVQIWAGCVYSILQQIDTRVACDHGNHYSHYVGEGPVVFSMGLSLQDSICAASQAADLEPSCRVFLGRCDDNSGWHVVRSFNSTELYSLRLERIEHELNETLEYIEAGAYDKSSGRDKAQEQAFRNYRREFALLNGGEEAEAWAQMEQDRVDEDEDEDDVED